jgi:uncharacterized membrane protein
MRRREAREGIDLNLHLLRLLAGESIFASVPQTVFWPYCAGAVILAAWMVVFWKELPTARGFDRVGMLGRLFFAAPMAVFGTQHFTEAGSVATIVPAWLPAPLFWTLLVGAALELAALSIVVKKYARWAAMLLALMLILFIAFIHTRNVIANPRDVLMWALGFRDLAFSGGALALAGIESNQGRAEGKSVLITIARAFVAIAALFFGVNHFVHPAALPAVDLDRLTPTWIWGHSIWAYFAGSIFLGAGACLLASRTARLAATGMSIMTLLLLLFVYLPIVVSAPADIDNGLNYFVSTLAFCGAALLTAAALGPTNYRGPSGAESQRSLRLVSRTG